MSGEDFNFEGRKAQRKNCLNCANLFHKKIMFRLYHFTWFYDKIFLLRAYFFKHLELDRKGLCHMLHSLDSICITGIA